MVRAQRRSRFRDFDDGIGKLRHFHFGRAPGKLDARIDVVARDIAVRFTTSVAITFPSRSFTDCTGPIFRHRENPAHGREALLRVHQFADFRDI
jgi:hypothetical protein